MQLHWLHVNDISSADMRGQCYDGATNMSGARSGVKSIIQKAAPKAMYYHCAAHRLNLSVVSACSIHAFKNAESYLGEMARFFNFSEKGQRLLDRAIEACTSTNSAKQLKDACRTRWVDRIDSYIVFLELLPATRKLWFIPICTLSLVKIGSGIGKRSPRPTVFFFSFSLPLS